MLRRGEEPSLADQLRALGEEVYFVRDLAFRELFKIAWERLTVVWDRSNTHDRSRAVKKFLRANPRVRTERFPGHAPDLNPDDGVWDHAKYARMPNFTELAS